MKYKFGLLMVIILMAIAQQGYGQHYMYSSDAIKKFGRFFNWVTNYYVDSIDEDDMAVSAIKGVLKELDPHSTYIDKDEVASLNQSLKGSFEGIGIQFNILNDTILVVSTITGGPSEEVGLNAGDRIIKVDGENVAGIDISNEGVRKRLMGEKGSTVDIQVKRPGISELLSFSIERDKIPLESLDAAYMLDDNTGYFKLNRFSATTVDEFKESFYKLKQEGLEDLVLDLRGNGGGYLKSSEDLASQFLKDNRLIVYTNGVNVRRENYHAEDDGVFEEGRLIVLIDEGSASASEIVSGAVQDWDRGVIIGRRSFGKGLVQQPLRFRDNSMVRLTIARYYTPTGRLIQKPYENGVKEYRKEIEHRYEHGEMYNADSIDFPDSLKYRTMRNKRTVYGGGGIMPDIFVPADTSDYSDFYREVVAKGLLTELSLEYLDSNRKLLNKQYPDFKKFEKEFQVPESEFQALLKEAKARDISYEESKSQVSKEAIKQQMKALIARDLWNLDKYFYIINQSDNVINRAMEVLNNSELYKKQLKRDSKSHTME